MTTDAPQLPRIYDEIDRARTRSAVGSKLFGSRPQDVKIGRFVIEGTAGAGQMGRVYVGRDPDLDRKVAIKVIGDGRDHEIARGRERRLAREARAIAKLSHPNVIAVHEVGHHDGALFIVMEYIDGETLREWLATPRAWREALRVMIAAGRGLVAAHGAGLVHRDFKPANVMIGRDGRVVVLDFGLARLPSEHTTDDGVRIDLSDAPEETLTAAGAMVGTPAYMAPELHHGAPADAKSDQFAFAVTLFEALHGERPFEFQRWHRDTGPAIVRRPRKIPDWLHQLIVKAVREEPRDRHTSMEVLVAALAKRRLRPRTVVLAATGLAAVAALGASAATLATAGKSCDGGQQRVASVWSDTRRATLVASLRQRTDGGDVQDRRLVEGLDAYVHEWTQVHREACERTHVHADQSEAMLDLRVACLDDRLASFDALVRVLEAADNDTLRRAPRATESLPALAACEDAEHVSATMLAPTDDRAPAVAEARLELAQAEAMITGTGQFAEALRIAEEVQHETRDVDFLPLRAEVLLALGRAQELVGRREDAERTNLDAANAAEAAGYDEALRDAWWQAIFSADDGDRAQLYLERAQAVISRMGETPFAAQKMASARGKVTSAQGDHEAALDHFARAREIALDRDDAQGAATSLLSMTRAAYRLGRWSEAQEHAARAKEELVEVHGPHHPTVVRASRNRAAALIMSGDYRAAIDAYYDAYELSKALDGDTRQDESSTFHNIGAAHHQLGEYDQALLAYQRALQVQETLWGSNDPRLASTMANVSRALVSLGRFDEAIETGERAHQLLIEARGERHRDVAQARGGLASVYLRAGRVELALEALQETVAMEVEIYGGENVDSAMTRSILSDAYRKAGELHAAQAEAELALSVFRRDLGNEHEKVARTLTTLGQVRFKRKRYARAAVDFEEAVAIYRSAEAEPLDVGEARFGLAQALIHTGGDKARALELAEAARAAFADGGTAWARREATAAAFVKRHSPK